MKTKLIFLITVAIFSAKAIASQQDKDRQIQAQLQTQKSAVNWSFKYCPPGSVAIDKQDSIVENGDSIKIEGKTNLIICDMGKDAEFPGGWLAFNQYFMENLVLIESDSSQLMSGCQSVFVQFSIDETGIVLDPVIVKSAGTELDKAVITVIKAMPRWVPATCKGENISTNLTLPIQIYLN